MSFNIYISLDAFQVAVRAVHDSYSLSLMSLFSYTCRSLVISS